jgi:hypothetical protein
VEYLDTNEHGLYKHDHQLIKGPWFIVQTTGGTIGLEAEFSVKSLDELNTLIFEHINKIDGVVKTEVSLIMDFTKRRYDWGTAMDEK